MKEKSRFKKVFDNLDQNQKDAVTARDNYIVVLGGSGTGKTMVTYCYSAFQVLEQRCNSDELLIFTNYSDYQKDFEKNIYKLIGENYSKIWINMFNSFCVRILHKYWHFIKGVNPNFKILNNFKRNVIINDILENEGFGKFTKDRIYEIAEFIRLLKQNMITANDFKEIISKDIFSLQFKSIKNVYQNYTDVLNAHNYLDYEDTVIKTIDFFDDIEKSKECLNGFKRIIVDDLLEINPLQYKLIKVLVEKIKGVFITCDDKQTAFGFYGSVIKNALEKFIEDFPTIKNFHLKNNYRSDGQLLNAVEKFYKYNSKDVIEVPKSIYNFSNNFLTIAIEKSIIDEAFYIGKKVKKIILTEEKSILPDNNIKNFTYSDFAILLRNVDEYGFIYREVLDYLKIPNKIYGSFDVSNCKELTYLLLYLTLLNNPYDDLAFKKILSNSYSGFNILEYISISKLVRKVGKSFYEVLKNIESKIIIENEQSELYDKVRIFMNRFNILLKCVNEESFPDFIMKVVHSTSLDNFDMMKNEMSILGEFIRISLDYYEMRLEEGLICNLRDFLDFIEEQAEIIFSDITFDKEESDAVTITSIHRTRGKEFSVVFIPLLTEHHFPKRYSEERFFYSKDFEVFCKRSEKIRKVEFYCNVVKDYDDFIEREESLFSLALNRAKEKLFLSFPNVIPGVEDVRPSMFLKCLLDGKEVDRENCESVKLNGNSIIYDENFYSNFIYNATQINKHIQEIYEHITSKEELEIILRGLIKNEVDKGKIMQLLNSYGFEYLDKSYIISDDYSFSESPIAKNIGANFVYSHSSIKTFLECPRKFYYSKIIKLEAPKGVHLLIGTIEHEIVQNIHNRFKSNQMNEKNINIIFDEVWTKYKNEFDNEFYQIIWKIYILDRICDYVNKYGRSAENIYAIEKDFNFYLNGKYSIYGRIDRIDKRGDGYELIDYKKSGEGRETALINQFYKYDIDFQMPLYYFAAKDVLKINPKVFSFIFFDFNRERKCEKIEINVSESDDKCKSKEVSNSMMEQVKMKILSILDEIAKDRYGFDRHRDAKCIDFGGYSCEYLNICNQSQL